jgi:hypothetical protein
MMSGLQIALIALGIFAGMLCLMEAGRQIGRSWIRKQWTESEGSFTALEGSVFALMGLLIAFTFSAAAARFEMRRQLVVEEVNDIGTAWRRLELLPPARQSVLREDFRRYVDSRLTVYRNIGDPEAVRQGLLRTAELQDEIWSRAIAACAEASSVAVTTLVLTSLNAMIDITTTRTVAARTHLPGLITALLAVLPLVCALLAGIDAAPNPHRSWIHMVGFALILALTVYVILDLEYPRVGLVRLDMFDQALVDLRNSMH